MFFTSATGRCIFLLIGQSVNLFWEALWQIFLNSEPSLLQAATDSGPSLSYNCHTLYTPLVNRALMGASAPIIFFAPAASLCCNAAGELKMDTLKQLLENPDVVRGAGIVVSALLFVISAIHGYWTLGGRRGVRAAIPELDGRPVFRVTTLGTFTVMFLLLLAGVILLGSVGIYGDVEPEFLYSWTPWTLFVVFFIRAVGDFRYAGIFKKVRYTYFAWWDTFVYIPLCLLIAALCLVVALGQNAVVSS